MINAILCEGETPLYIFYATDIPRYIYYIFVPSIAITFLLGLFVFLKNKKDAAARTFFGLTVIMTIWMITMLGNWAQNDSGLSVFFDELNVFVGIIPPVFLYFVMLVFYKEKLSFLKTVLIFIPALPLLLFMGTVHNVSSIELGWCETSVGKLYWYLAFELIFYAIITFFLLFKSIRIAKDSHSRKQILFILTGFTVWTILSAMLGVILSVFGYPQSTLWAPVSCVAFTFFVTWSIIKYGFLNIKTIMAQVLTIAVWILIASQYLFVQNTVNRILVSITLILSIGFGYMLIKSIKTEVKRKEELQEMSDKLSKANDQLRKLDNAKSEFISIASHQLRTPLTAIKGFISLILEGSYGKISAEIDSVLNKVYLSNERLIELVEDLLNLSRIESGRMEYKFEKINLGEVCQEIYDTFILHAKDKNLKLDLILPENSIVEATTDRNKIREVISNLVDNALKYTEKGGVKVKLAEIGDNIQIAITDTGIGVPAEEIPYLFSKFSRGKDVGRLNAGGTGLGLHVGRRMTEALSGRIWVESKGANMGSTFFIEVPKGHVEEA